MYDFSGEMNTTNLIILWLTLEKKSFAFFNLGSQKVCLCNSNKILIMNMTSKTIELFTKENLHFHR